MMLRVLEKILLMCVQLCIPRASTLTSSLGYEPGRAVREPNHRGGPSCRPEKKCHIVAEQ